MCCEGDTGICVLCPIAVRQLLEEETGTQIPAPRLSWGTYGTPGAGEAPRASKGALVGSPLREGTLRLT